MPRATPLFLVLTLLLVGAVPAFAQNPAATPGQLVEPTATPIYGLPEAAETAYPLPTPETIVEEPPPPIAAPRRDSNPDDEGPRGEAEPLSQSMPDTVAAPIGMLAATGAEPLLIALAGAGLLLTGLGIRLRPAASRLNL